MSFCHNESIKIERNSTKIKKYNRCYLILGIILLLSEIWKQYTLTFVLNNGEYQWSYIPFQLCSMPMYLCLFLGLSGSYDNGYPVCCRMQTDSEGLKTFGDRKGRAKVIGTGNKSDNALDNTYSTNKRTAAVNTGKLSTARRACMVFLADYSLMSGLITFLDTSGLHYGYAPLTIHSYLWHITIAGIGVYSGLNLIHSCDRGGGVSLEKQTCPDSKVSQADICRSLSCGELHQGCSKPHLCCAKYAIRFSDFIPASCIFLICCGIAELINLCLDRYGIVNMFYINPHYYVNQMVFYDLAHIIPNNIVIVLYILCAMLAAFIVHIAWMLFAKKD